MGMRRRLGFRNNAPTAPSGPVYTNDYAISLDGANDIATAGPSLTLARDYNQSFWVSLWLQFNVNTGQDGIVVSRRSGDRGWAIRKQDSRFFVYMINTYPTNMIIRSSPNNASSGTSLMHLLLSYDGSATAAGAVLYKNGSALAMVTVDDVLSATLLTGNEEFAFGANYNGSGSDFCETAKYNDAYFGTGTKSAADAARIYNAGVAESLTSEPNVVAGWFMGDGTGDAGTNVNDQVGANNLTLLNGASIVAA